jgi:hypothetical protein
LSGGVGGGLGVDLRRSGVGGLEGRDEKWWWSYDGLWSCL